jgi:hypothetical protein
MAKANIHYSTSRLSQLFTDPVVRAAFDRAEPDDGANTWTIVTISPRTLDGGAAELVLMPAEALS